ncbi:MAG: phosphoadenylyl-sulfate reductase [Pseudomonadota bacterium]|nr:phosphoadenylyl-sulfate reductase [Pseudomonadota bacterium]
MKFAPHHAYVLNQRFRGTDTDELLREIFADASLGRLAIVSSFGSESAVLLHLAAQIDPAVPVLMVDTLRLFPETLAYRRELAARLGLKDVRTVTPDPQLLAARDAAALRWSYDPDGCCAIRKVEPLRRALTGFDAWISGRKAFQSPGRSAIPRFETDDGRLKINPLADWTRERLAGYAAEHGLPQHPLVSQGYPSIGCVPCTSPVRPGEDLRAGRWRGWDKTECGIHGTGAGGGEPDLPIY